jgi:hypothetical protein
MSLHLLIISVELDVQSVRLCLIAVADALQILRGGLEQASGKYTTGSPIRAQVRGLCMQFI